MLHVFMYVSLRAILPNIAYIQCQSTSGDSLEDENWKIVSLPVC